MAEYYEGAYPYCATIYLDEEEGDLESLYNILAYYRLSGGYDRALNDKASASAVLCEKLFQDVRESLGRE